MANSTDMAYRRDNFILQFLDSVCQPTKEYYQMSLEDFM